jgi:peptidoglycan hydrolase-like protein with peptidoglycan-binding domain
LKKNDLVKEIQVYLNRQGYEAGVEDGLYGTKTKNAILSFQEANGLAVDGSTSPSLLSNLQLKEAFGSIDQR